ncbi:putative Transcriptional regulator, LysR family [uncultured delta proteobacterium]|uniref:Putative Transcriptional regulator, LysR family n=1 Tax=uncultured delta proteobacterium TaxID=34034 RepID=A0A212JCR2_9DELT|nr:putative Transcriptional regulator, LysR family [uncultured delta proteobacterium]
MNLQQLLFVVETAKKKSINKAAKALHTSQPNLSKAIIGLEEELNVTLFTRTKQGVLLTEDGLEFIHYATSLLEQFNDIKLTYERKNSSLPIIRVTTSRMSYTTRALIDCYNTHLKDAPAFKIYFREVSPYKVYRDVIEGAADLAIVQILASTLPFWKKIFENNSIEYHFLFECGGHILLNKNHPLMKQKKITFRDLEKYPMIQSFESSGEMPNFETEIESLRYKNFPKIFYTGERAVFHNILHETDAIFFCVTDANVDIFYDDVASIPLAEIVPDVAWQHYLLKRKNKQLSQEEHWYIESLFAVVEEYTKSHPPRATR